MNRKPLLLASQSPRRAEILNQLGIDFHRVPISVDEVPRPGELPAAYVCRLAEEKATAGLRESSTGSVVLGADTVVVCDDCLLEKPLDKADAMRMWHRLSGRTHQVLSAVCLASDQHIKVELSVTEVLFRSLPQALLDRYWETGEGLDKAGGYAIQGLGAAFVKSISGSYSGVVGLPIEKLIPLLDDFDIQYWCHPVVAPGVQ